MKVKRKPIIQEAIQWDNNKEHPLVSPYSEISDKNNKCHVCKKPLQEHGWSEGLQLCICPNDWIVKEPTGKYLVCSDEDFFELYTPVFDSSCCPNCGDKEQFDLVEQGYDAEYWSCIKCNACTNVYKDGSFHVEPDCM